MIRRSTLLVISLVAVSVSAQDVAISGARIEIGNGKTIDNGTILIRGGKIAAVGNNVQIPSGVTTLDAKGMVAYPGFIDGYTSKGLKLPDQTPGASAPSITSVAPPTMWQDNRSGIRAQVSAASCLNFGSSLKDAHAAGITAALFLPGGATIRGAGAFAYWTDEKVAPKPYGMEMSFRGGGGRPAGGSGYPGTLLGVIALLRQTLYDAQTYAQTPDAKKDADYDALQPVLKATTPAIFAADSDLDIARAISMGAEFGFPIVIEGGRDGYKRAKMLVDKHIAVLANISPGEEPSQDVAPDGPPKPVLQERHDIWKERSANILRLNEAGVKVAFSSDYDGMDDYLKDIRKLIALGLPKAAALKAMTVTPAEIFGVDKDLGTLETGKQGNVVLMSGDFADEKSKVNKVVVLGKVFDGAEVSK